MEVCTYTNAIANGWHPADLDRFLGGNEETLVLWSRAMARAGHRVTVHTTLRGKEFVDPHGVSWRQRESFSPHRATDVLISFKTREPWMFPTQAGLRIHWSNDVEPPWSNGLLRQIDHFVYLSTMHGEHVPWKPEGRSVMIPLAVDPHEYRPGDSRDEHLAIYATSPDRGLDILLKDWPRLQVTHPGLRLLVTYDWARVHPQALAQWAPLLNQPGITRDTFDADGIKEAFQTARFYIHTLNRNASDLFGFGAMKAEASGCAIVVPSVRDNGFRDSVKRYVPYADFLRGQTEPVENPDWQTPPMSWDAVVAEYWQPLLSGKGVRHVA